MPEELIGYLFAKCGVKELLACGQTSTYMQHHVRKACVWKMNHSPINPIIFQSTQALFSFFSDQGEPSGDAKEVMRLALEGTSILETLHIDQEVCMQIAEWFPNVNSLSMNYTDVAVDALSHLSALNLKKLSVLGNSYSEKEEKEIRERFPNLEALRTGYSVANLLKLCEVDSERKTDSKKTALLQVLGNGTHRPIYIEDDVLWTF